jgi:LacI family transcriptional regulator
MAKQRRVAVMIDLEWSYRHHAEVYAGCQQYAAEARWDCTNSQFADQAIEPRPGGSPYDGILGRIEGKTADKAKLAGVPVVNVWMNSPAKPALSNVFADFEAIGVMAARHLLGRGFRQFGFMGHLRDVSTRLHLKGFRSELKASGLSCSTHRFPAEDPYRARTWGAFSAGLAAWVDTLTTPIGICTTHDLNSRFLIDVCRSKGLSVPQDVAIVGAGNEDVICTSPPPTLTSIDLNCKQIGYQAAALLDRLMDGEAPVDEPLLIPPAELVPRESTDSHAVDDSVVARALRFIAEHGHESITVDDVVAATPASRRSLERRFQKAMRRTISEEITRLRLERAKRRLAESDDALKNVAADAGFSSLNHFYRAFVRLEGISPKEYRKQRRRE